MPLARVGARTESTTRYSYNARRGQFSRTRIGIVPDAFAPRVCTLVLFIGSVCASVCLLSHISPTKRPFVLKTLSRTQRATKVKKFVGIWLIRLRSRVMPRNMSEKTNMLIIPTYRCQLSPLDTQRKARGYTTVVNNIQPCPKLCLLMPLARVGARTDSITSYSYNARGVANFRARALA